MIPAFAQVSRGVLYTHPDKLLSVRFPEKPKEVEQDAPSVIGTLHFKAALVKDDVREYLTTALVYPIKGKFDLKNGFAEARNQALAAIHGKAVSEKSIKLDPPSMHRHRDAMYRQGRSRRAEVS